MKHNPERIPQPIIAAQKTGLLTLRSDAVVSHVSIDPNTGKAKGVVFIDRTTKQEHEVLGKVVVLCASTHVSLNAPNALVQESVRAYYRGWYREIVTALPEVADGYIAVPPGPGLGMELMPDLAQRFTVTTRTSKAE